MVYLVRDAYESVFIFDFMYRYKSNAPFKRPSAYRHEHNHTHVHLMENVRVCLFVYCLLWQQKNATNGFMFHDHGLCGWKFTSVQLLIFRSTACQFSFPILFFLLIFAITQKKNLIWFMTDWVARWHDPSNRPANRKFPDNDSLVGVSDWLTDWMREWVSEWVSVSVFRHNLRIWVIATTSKQ